MYELGDKRIPLDEPLALLGFNPYPGCKHGGHGEACRGCCALNEALRHANAGDPDYQKVLVFRDGKYRWQWNGKLCDKFDHAARKILSLKYDANILCTYQGDISLWSVAQIIKTLGLIDQLPQHTFFMASRNPSKFYKKLRKACTQIPHSLPSNMIFVTSVESRKYIKRIDALKADFSRYEKRVFFTPLIGEIGKVNLFGIKAVHIWAEAGRNARPCKREWIIDLCNQCIDKHIYVVYAPVWAVKGRVCARTCALRTGIRESTGKQWRKRDQYLYPLSREELYNECVHD